MVSLWTNCIVLVIKIGHKYDFNHFSWIRDQILRNFKERKEAQMNENGKEGGFKFIILVLTWIPDDKTGFNKLMILKDDFGMKHGYYI